jgi:hypothetical protein
LGLNQIFVDDGHPSIDAGLCHDGAGLRPSAPRLPHGLGGGPRLDGEEWDEDLHSIEASMVSLDADDVAASAWLAAFFEFCREAEFAT